MLDGLYRVETSYLCAGFVVENGVAMKQDILVRYVPVKGGWSWEILCKGQVIKSDDTFYTQEMAKRDANQVITTVARKAHHAKMGYTTELYADNW